MGISGYSGAGTKKSVKNDVEYLTGGVLPYSVTDHMHELASWFRGIHLTIYVPLNKKVTSRDITSIFQERYAGEKLVKIVGEMPYVKAIQNKHGVEIGGFAIDQAGKSPQSIISTRAPVLKNMNLALGYAEYEGIPIM
ncbi:hypothetical protein GGI35DRAFT_478212 [Trichoderma velutinum]